MPLFKLKSNLEIKNPISAARTVLDLSTSQLTLRRVPPNLLVGQGATDWAFCQGIPVLPHDALISPAARERWWRWKQDLKNEERKRARQSQRDNSGKTLVPAEPPPKYQESVQGRARTEQTAAIRTGVWNEGQPASSPLGIAAAPYSNASTPSRASSVDSHATQDTPATPVSDNEHAVSSISDVIGPLQNGRIISLNSVTTQQDAPSDSHYVETTEEDSEYLDTEEGYDIDETGLSAQERHVSADACRDDDDSDYRTYSNRAFDANDDDDSGSTSSSSTLRLPSLTPSPPAVAVADNAVGTQLEDLTSNLIDITTTTQDESQRSSTKQGQEDSGPSSFSHQVAAATEGVKDLVFDTVGAIAIDNEGNIACGASSGGIGMKFRGRIGPAALVGVGAAVYPLDPEDKTRMSTACVTSGTGEHMATTGAAQVCADRLYNSVRKRRGGGFEACEDEQAVKAMIENDFMGHPGIRSSHSMGAIGVLAVKKTANGAYLYFAHNTDSFALASMSSEEAKPNCTMSRSHGNGMVAQGGRAIRYKKRW